MEAETVVGIREIPGDAGGRKIWMAPLRGVTLAPFRRLLAERFGCVDLALAPFVAAPR